MMSIKFWQHLCFYVCVMCQVLTLKFYEMIYIFAHIDIDTTDFDKYVFVVPSLNTIEDQAVLPAVP